MSINTDITKVIEDSLVLDSQTAQVSIQFKLKHNVSDVLYSSIEHLKSELSYELKVFLRRLFGNKMTFDDIVSVEKGEIVIEKGSSQAVRMNKYPK